MSAWLDSLQSFGIVASIGVAAWAIRAQTTAIRASVAINLSDKTIELNKVILDHHAAYARLNEDFVHGDDPDERDAICAIILTIFELAYIEHAEHGALSRDDWAAWTRMMVAYVEKPYLRGYWSIRQAEYNDGFIRSVNSAREKILTTDSAL